jgi:hypothetical protein
MERGLVIGRIKLLHSHTRVAIKLYEFTLLQEPKNHFRWRDFTGGEYNGK